MKSADYEALESELLEDLRWFSQNSILPKKYQAEPGAFLHLVLSAWKRDMRQYAEFGLINFTKRINAVSGIQFTLNQVWAAFFEKRPLYMASIARPMASAALDIALANWTRQNYPTRCFLQFPGLKLADLENAKANAVEAMFRSGKVYCRDKYAHSFRPRANIMPILRLLLASEVDEVSLKEVDELVRSIQLAGLERVVTLEMVKGCLRNLRSR